MDADNYWYLLQDGKFVWTNIWNDIYIDKLYTHTFSGQHDDTARWVWDELNNSYQVTLYMECDVCGEEQIVGTVYVDLDSAVVTNEATETENGSKTYTATVSNNGKTYTGTKEVVIPKTGGYVKIGNVNYNSLQEALEAAYSGQTITLYDDIDEPEGSFDDYRQGKYSNYMSLTIELNGHTANFGYISTYYDLTFKDGTWNGTIGNWGGTDSTLTLDNATVNTPESEDEYGYSLRWSARNIVLENGSELNLGGNAAFGDENTNSTLTLMIDETSNMSIDAGVVISSDSYGEAAELICLAIVQYLPEGYSINSEGYVVDSSDTPITEPVILTADAPNVGKTLIDDYKTNGTYPTQEGKLFAGWYEGEDFTTPYTGDTKFKGIAPFCRLS